MASPGSAPTPGAPPPDIDPSLVLAGGTSAPAAPGVAVVEVEPTSKGTPGNAPASVPGALRLSAAMERVSSVS